MSATHEVISAFLDDEPFNPSTLAEALSEPSGRALLIDLIALRHLARADGSEVPALPDRTSWRSSLRAIVAVAAAIFVALIGGYLVGQRQSELGMSTAPAATRVVDVPTAWQDVPAGRMQ